MEKIIPDFLINKINDQYSKEEVEQILYGLKQEKKTTFRVNQIKSNMQEIESILKNNNIKFETNNYLKDAFILENGYEKQIRELDIYKKGKIYLQSLSSMIPIIVLEPNEKENILDMCAAPRRKNDSNGKSNQ